MTEIKIVPLGAGQDVGRSCIVVSIGSKNIMFDCGMHMGYNDRRRFPDFSYITRNGPITELIDCVIISHFHLDHCGALPFMTEMVGYNGPLYMTHPTKAICPILLEDYRKIQVDRKGEQNFFTSEMIKNCMKKTTGVNLHQVIQVDDEIEIKAYYAGHVLGAAMFHVKVGEQSIVYTGDYNMTPDRHLGAAWIDKVRPDVLITESTYATTIRDSKRCRERDFLQHIHDCVNAGGKVLIPVFALGRVQELCILLESYWDRMNIDVPIYYSMGLSEKANQYYKLFITWTSEKIRKTFVERNLFLFKYIKPFDTSYADLPGPMVVFATPGMLHAGTSLTVFKKWCSDPKNMVIMPGYCVAGTVGAKVIANQKKIFIDGAVYEVKLSVKYMSFSAHADAKGIMQLIKFCEPANVVLVHGEAEKMDFLKAKITQQFGIPCYKPANGENVVIHPVPRIPVDVSVKLLNKRVNPIIKSDGTPDLKRARSIQGALIFTENRLQLVDTGEASNKYGLPREHDIRFTSRHPLPHYSSSHLTPQNIKESLYKLIKSHYQGMSVSQGTKDNEVGLIAKIADTSLLIEVQETTSEVDEEEEDEEVPVQTSTHYEILTSWSYLDEEIGSTLQKIISKFIADAAVLSAAT